MGIFDKGIMLMLCKELDATALRQRVIANNIANLNTPGFKRSVVHFEDLLKEKVRNKLPLQSVSSQHMDSAIEISKMEPGVVQDKRTTMRSDGNNVNLESEMIGMVMNNITYQAVVQMVSGRIATLSYVITERRI